MDDTGAEIIPIQTKKTISKEVANEQFDSLLDYYGIEFAHFEMEDGPEAAQTLKNMLVAAIMRGELQISVKDEGLSVVQTLVRGTAQTPQITYTDKVAHARIAMDQESPKKTQRRMIAFMATMANLPPSELLKLKGVDVATFSRLSTVFSMV